MRTGLCLFAIFFVQAAAAQQTPRIFVTDSKSWEVSGGFGGSSDGVGGGASGGARPQTAEIIKTFGERCPQVIVNNNREKADYVVLLDHEGGKNLVRKDNKVAVFNREGDVVVSRSTVSLGNAVKDACAAIVRDWPRHQEAAARAKTSLAAEAAAAESGTAKPSVAAPSSSLPAHAELQVTSTPAGAEIEINGDFVGTTPSSIRLEPGTYAVRISKSGFKEWQRKVKVTGGAVNLAAELEKAEVAQEQPSQ